jgi:hypothetical protein
MLRDFGRRRRGGWGSKRRLIGVGSRRGFGGGADNGGSGGHGGLRGGPRVARRQRKHERVKPRERKFLLTKFVLHLILEIWVEMNQDGLWSK